MGCTASRLDDEDLVRRCKERNLFMMKSLSTRHRLATAVADYCYSLIILGAAFTAFAGGEPFSVSNETPAVFLPTGESLHTTTSYHTTAPPSPTQAPVSQSPSVAKPKLPPPTSRNRRRQRRIKGTKKVPHVLSESDDNSHTSKTSSSNSDMEWDKMAPPSPSVYLGQLDREENMNEDKENHDPQIQTHQQQQRYQHDHVDDDEEEEEGECTTTNLGDARSDFGSSVQVHYDSTPPTPSALKPKLSSPEKPEIVESSSSTGQRDNVRVETRHPNLKEIVDSIKVSFDQAADAGKHVSDILETSPAQLHRNFRKSKKTVLLSYLGLNTFGPGSVGEPRGSKSLSLTLEQLLCCEKKLYEKVKAREAVEFELKKKLSALVKLENQGGDETNLNKLKESIEKLRLLSEIKSQAANEASTAIVQLLDVELVSQLIELCHGFMCMWRSMNQCHEVQNQVVQQVLSLVNQSTNGETTADHHQNTRYLESAVSGWHTSFCRLIKFQRDFIESLHGWFTRIPSPTGTEKANNGSQPSNINNHNIFYHWGKLTLDHDLSHTMASKAIRAFIDDVKSILKEQAAEMKQKKSVKLALKRRDKINSSLRRKEKKYNYSGLDDQHGLDAYKLRTKLMACQNKVQDELHKHSEVVVNTRAKTLEAIQKSVPRVFAKMTTFSSLITKELEDICIKSSATT